MSVKAEQILRKLRNGRQESPATDSFGGFRAGREPQSPSQDMGMFTFLGVEISKHSESRDGERATKLFNQTMRRSLLGNLAFGRDEDERIV